jgi:hypothetical protein
MIDNESYSPPTATTPAQLKIPYVGIVYLSTTSIRIEISQPSVSPASYGGSITSYTFNDPDFVINSAGNMVTITGMTPGKRYSLRVRAYTGANSTGTFGDYYYESITMPLSSPVTSVQSSSSGTAVPPNSGSPVVDVDNTDYNDIDPTESTVIRTPVPTGTSTAVSGNRQVKTSLFSISNNNKSKDSCSVAIKNLGINTSATYYSFGTAMFFQSNVSKTQASGGIGFFTDSIGKSGYYVYIKTTSSLISNDEREVQIFKIVEGKKIVLTDSQKTGEDGLGSKLGGIKGGSSYKVDVKVKIESGVVAIDVYINNFKISAVDATKSGTSKAVEKIIPATANFALFAMTGTVLFDYIYATPLSEEQYTKGGLQNVYNGQFAKTTLDFLYGEKVLSNFDKASVPGGVLEEFGTTARELRRTSVKYPERPGYPVYASVNTNKFINILGSRLTSFGAEIYLLNNAGTYVPLDDGAFHSFNVVGNYVVPGGTHEYSETLVNENSDLEPVVFESAWIQTENDAKRLTSWIKTQWSKQQQIVTASIFSNPAISVGDIINITYPKNDLDGTKKFVVQSVSQSYGEGGLDTSIVARSLNS